MRLLCGFILFALAAASKLRTRSTWNLTCYVRATTINLRQVSAVLSTFVYDGSIQYAWRDDSLFDYADDGVPYTQAIGESSALWPNATAIPGSQPYPLVIPSVKGQVTPSPVLSSSWKVVYGVPAWLPEVVVAKDLTKVPSVWVQGRFDYTGLVVLAPQDLRDFPLDTQTVTLQVANANLPAADMNFVLTADLAAPFPGSSMSPPASPDGYTLVGTRAVLANTTDGLSAFALQWRLQRVPDFFFNRFVLPMVLVNILILALNGANPATRLMAAFTMMGTVVSFLFVSGQSVPQLPYATRLDKFFTLQFFFAALVGLANMYSSNRTDRMKSHVYLSVWDTLKGLARAAPSAPAKKTDGAAPGEPGASAGAKAADQAEKGEAAAEAAAAPAGVKVLPTSAELLLGLREPVSGMNELALARAMFERKLKMDQKALDKAAADKKKADEDKIKHKAEVDKHNAQLSLDWHVSLTIAIAYCITVPCIFYA